MEAGSCPWLGTEEDRDTRHAEPTAGHLCYAQRHPTAVDLEVQSQTCLTAGHRACAFFTEPPLVVPPPPPAVPAEDEDQVGPPPRHFSPWLWLLWLAVIALAAVAVYSYVSALRVPRATPTPSVAATSIGSFGATPTATPSLPPASPQPTFQFVEPTATLTPVPGGSVYTLSPAADAVGWVAGDEVNSNHMGDSYLYTGVFDGVVYHGVFQFDLVAVPRGAAIHRAVLEIAGLDARRMSADGVWEVRILAPEADEHWSRTTYQAVHNAMVAWTLSPPLGVGDLAVDRVNVFELPRQVLDDLQVRLLDGHSTLSFRLDGPMTGANNVFAWDSGYGAATQGRKPRLLLSVGAAPLTPIPTGTPRAVVVTSTPTPVNVVTAAVWARTATAVVRLYGQPTATSVYVWTATPTVAVTNTPLPANSATADYRVAEATAIAFTTGTFTPTPLSIVTATPTPLVIPVELLTPTPTPTPAPPTPFPAIPVGLVGQIAFRSNRAGGLGPWVIDPDSRQMGLLAAAWPYDAAARRETLSPDGSLEVVVGKYAGKTAILARPVDGGPGWPLVVVARGRVASPVWSPTGKEIAFAGSAGAGMQVWVVGSDGKNLRRVTGESSGVVSHPSFSPDGTRLVFAQFTADGRRQIWVINLDGMGRLNLSNNKFDEWDPVWLK